MAEKPVIESDMHGGRLRLPRSRGAVSGVLLVVLGVWGALIPFVGPYVDFGYTPDSSFTLNRARFWLELLPGVVTVIGGLLLVVAANRVMTSLGAWLAVAAGGWFLVGPTLDRLLHLGPMGTPIHRSSLGSTLETLLLFTGIGVLILFIGAVAVGRLGVVSVRDVRAAQRRERDATRYGVDENGQDVTEENHVTLPATTRSDSDDAIPVSRQVVAGNSHRSEDVDEGSQTARRMGEPDAPDDGYR
jgi:hypothetical protein